MIPRRPFFLLFFAASLSLFPGLLRAQEGKKPPQPQAQAPEKAGPALDPRVQAISKAMKSLASKPIPVHFKIRMEGQLPLEDQPLVAEGELWAVGDRKIRYVLTLKPGRLPPTHQELVANSEGAWMRFPGGGKVIFFPADLVARLREIQEKGGPAMSAPSARNQIDVISGLRDQGFRLEWKGQKKLGKVVVDVIEGTRPAPGKSGASMDDPEGKIDRVVLLVGEKDRITRRIEWFAGGKRVRFQEYLDVTVGKKIPEDIFQFKIREGETVVNALDHPIMGPTIRALLNQKGAPKKG